MIIIGKPNEYRQFIKDIKRIIYNNKMNQKGMSDKERIYRCGVICDKIYSYLCSSDLVIDNKCKIKIALSKLLGILAFSTHEDLCIEYHGCKDPKIIFRKIYLPSNEEIENIILKPLTLYKLTISAKFKTIHYHLREINKITQDEFTMHTISMVSFHVDSINKELISIVRDFDKIDSMINFLCSYKLKNAKINEIPFRRINVVLYSIRKVEFI